MAVPWPGRSCPDAVGCYGSTNAPRASRPSHGKTDAEIEADGNGRRGASPRLTMANDTTPAGTRSGLTTYHNTPAAPERAAAYIIGPAIAVAGPGGLAGH